MPQRSLAGGEKWDPATRWIDEGLLNGPPTSPVCGGVTHGSTYGRPRRAARHRLAAIPVLVAVAVLVSGCGDGDAASAENKPEHTQQTKTTTTTTTSSKPAPRYTVEQLAAKLGCKAELRGPTKGFRQASCKIDGEPYVFLDFEDAEGQRLWLDEAIGWGGIYLVGDRWAMSAKSKEYMESLSKTLGGTVEDKQSWHS